GARFLWYAGLLGVIGAGAFHLFVLPSATAQDSGPASAPAATGLTAAILLLAGILARLYAQTYATFGVEEPVTMALLLEVGTALPPWSSGWTLQAGAAVAALAALLIARAGFRAGWIGAQAAAVALAGTAPFTAHAAAQGDGYALVMVMHASHVLGAGIWLGGLFVL